MDITTRLSRGLLMRSIQHLELDLAGKVVLTEAATGPYAVTPLVAALAGARVMAYAASTRYGSQADVYASCQRLFSRLSLPPPELLTELTDRAVAEADLITNSGHLRPLDSARLKPAKRGAVVSLMYEAWEYRRADLDLEFCQKSGIAVAGVNECHPDVDVFGYLGDMAIRLMLEAGVTPYRNKVVLICNNPFGPFIARTLAKVCDRVGLVAPPETRSDYAPALKIGNVDWLGEFPTPAPDEIYRDAAAVLFTAHPFETDWSGKGKLSLREVKRAYPDAVFLRYAGHVPNSSLEQAGIEFFPREVKAGHMGVLPAQLGLEPTLRLQTAGLKVGELLGRGQKDFRGIELAQPLIRVTPTQRAA